MEKIADILHAYINMFTKITTWTLLAAAIFITAFFGTDTALGVELLWQILGLTFLCSVGCITFFKDSETVTKKGMMCRFILSYLFVSAVFIGGGFLCEWFYPSDWKMVLGMFLLVTAGYAIVTYLSFCTAKKEAMRMNEKLKEREQ